MTHRIHLAELATGQLILNNSFKNYFKLVINFTFVLFLLSVAKTAYANEDTRQLLLLLESGSQQEKISAANSVLKNISGLYEYTESNDVNNLIQILAKNINDSNNEIKKKNLFIFINLVNYLNVSASSKNKPVLNLQEYKNLRQGLINGSTDDDPQVRGYSHAGLIFYPADEGTLDTLLEQWPREGDTESKRIMLASLSRYNAEESVQIAYLALNDESAVIRGTAAKVIKKLSPESSVALPFLADRLTVETENGFVKNNLIKTMVSYGVEAESYLAIINDALESMKSEQPEIYDFLLNLVDKKILKPQISGKNVLQNPLFDRAESINRLSPIKNSSADVSTGSKDGAVTPKFTNRYVRLTTSGWVFLALVIFIVAALLYFKSRRKTH